jgi:flagellar hook-associated protein 3 FlgL
MPNLPGLGSQALPARLQRTGLNLRAEVQRHTVELTTGRAADPARRLGGEIGVLGAIETRLARIAAQETLLVAQGQRAAALQSGLDQVATIQTALKAATLGAATGEPSPAVLGRLGNQGRQALDDMVAALGRRLAGQAVFGGDRPDRAPLPPAEAFLSAAATAVAGATSADDVVQRIATLFHQPGGVFETALHAGGAPVRLAAGDDTVALPPAPTAADPALRDVLAGAVLAALAGRSDLLPDLDLRRDLALRAVEQHAHATEGLVQLRAGLGLAEASLSEHRLRLGAERDALVTSRQDRIGVDPYEAASRLEETRARLEALYAVTARVARLSLVEYLR